MNILKIGIIDDDSTKITQIMTRLLEGWDTASVEKRTKYSEYQLSPIEIPVCSNMEDTSDLLKQNQVDCVLIDYRLSSYTTVNYTGIDLANYLSNLWRGFPIFVLTSYEDDIYAKEIFDVYQVFNFDRYLNDTDERIELNTKVIEQILKYRKERIAWEQELIELLPRAGENAQIDARIIQLDGFVESAVDGAHSIPAEVKRQLAGGKIDSLLEKLDRLIEKE